MNELNPTSIGQRLKMARKSVGLTHEQVCQVFKCKRTTVSNWENDKNLPETAKLAQLAEMYRVSIDWLLGVGPGPNEEIENLIDLYRHVSPVQRRAVLRLIRAWIEPPITPAE